MSKMRNIPGWCLVSVLLGCGGSGSDGPANQYLVDAIASHGGQVEPASIEVSEGDSATFNLLLNPGYQVAIAEGCDGTLEATAFVTAPITADCTLTLSFEPIMPQPAQQVVNLNTSASPTVSSDPDDFVVLNGVAYFAADDGVHGRELWRTDGTAIGTWMVADIHPGARGSLVRELTLFGDKLCFWAFDGDHMSALWCSDGTEAGTQQVAALGGHEAWYFPNNLTAFNDLLFFVADDGVHGREPWRSDGTQEGTYMLKDMFEGLSPSFPHSFTVFDGAIYFVARATGVGHELWRSEGTEATTTLVKDIKPGLGSALGSETFFSMAVHDGWLYFPADDGVEGTELWRTDGTEAGTQRVLTIRANGDSDPRNLYSTPLGLVFWANDGVNGIHLWLSDGTEVGTTPLPGTGSSGASFKVVYDPDPVHYIYFIGGDDNAVWRSNGTEAGTFELDRTNDSGSDNARELTWFDGFPYFVSTSDESIRRLYRIWVTNNPQTVSGRTPYSPESLTVMGDRLLFQGREDSLGIELWRNNGGTNTELLLNIAEDGGRSDPRILAKLGDRLVFSASTEQEGRELWVTDGTAAGTEILSSGGAPARGGLQRFDESGRRGQLSQGWLYFARETFAHGNELWRTDGTPGNTELVADICSSSCNGFSSILYRFWASLDEVVYFAATETGFSSDATLWRTDGTLAGTFEVPPGVELSSNFLDRPMAILNDTLFFQGDIGTLELMKIDADGEAVLVRDTSPGKDSNPDWLTPMGNQLYFVANDIGFGRELWKTDGTFAGTMRVTDIVEGEGSSNPRELTVHEGVLYFSAYHPESGRELWRTDGTPEGTQMVKNILPGPDSGYPRAMISTELGLLFTAFQPDTGMEVWLSDGTEGGTSLLADIRSGSAGGMAAYMLAADPGLGPDSQTYWRPQTWVPKVNNVPLYSDVIEWLPVDDGRVVFRACDNDYGCQLWITDGSDIGTFRLTDLGVLPGGASPGHLTLRGDTVFFAATDALGQRELWQLLLPK